MPPPPEVTAAARRTGELRGVRDVRCIGRLAWLALVALVFLAGCTTAQSPSPTPSASSATGITRVVVVWMENEEASAVTASSMPYLFGLATMYGQATRMYGVAHPSLPNYLALWSGSTHGVTS